MALPARACLTVLFLDVAFLAEAFLAAFSLAPLRFAPIGDFLPSRLSIPNNICWAKGGSERTLIRCRDQPVWFRTPAPGESGSTGYHDAVAAKIIDGKALAARIKDEVAERVRALEADGVTPGLAAVLVGEDEASRIYVNSKQKACAEVGIRSERYDLPAEVPQAELLELMSRLSDDVGVHGILVQLPLPAHLSVLAVHESLSPAKDVDGLTPTSVGRLVRGEPTYLPATPSGIVEMLFRSGIETKGRDVVIVGRGPLVGMPLSIMLAQKSPRGNATVTLCHTATRDLAAHTRRADILVVAAGAPRAVTGDMVKPGAAVIDVGVNRTEQGLVGDVAFDEVAAVAGWITPVPGGVGPLTVAMLLVNTVAAAEAAATARAAGRT